MELGIETPELRWFKEMRSAYDSDPRPIVCGGLVLTPTFPGIVWLNVRAAMEPLSGLERTVWHECAHMAGYLSEDDADRVADRHVDGGETPRRDRGDEIQWIPSRAPLSTNYWELRTARPSTPRTSPRTAIGARPTYPVVGDGGSTSDALGC